MNAKTFAKYQRVNDEMNTKLGEKAIDEARDEIKGDQDVVYVCMASDGAFSHKRNARYVILAQQSIFCVFFFVFFVC